MADILTAGYEDLIRTKLGVTEDELPDSDINSPLIVNIAENVIKKEVPNWQLVVDPQDRLFLESAVIAYICYLLAPSMPNRINIEVQTLDVKWKKDKVDWKECAINFLAEKDLFLSKISSITVSNNASLVSLIRNERNPI